MMSVTPKPPGGADLLTRGQIVAWRNGVFVIFALPGIALASWASRLPSFKEALDIGVSDVGVLIFGIAAGSIVGLAASSHVIALVGARTTIAVSLCVSVGAVALAGFGASVSHSFAVVLIGFTIYGATAGMTDVAMNVSGAANERALGRSIMPIFHGFFSVGTVVGAGVGALVERADIPLAIHLGVVAALIAVTVVLVIRFVQSEHVQDDGRVPSVKHDSQSLRDRLGIWRDRRTLLIGVLVLAAAFAEGSANDWLAIALVDGREVSKPTGALIFGVFVAAMTVGRFAGVVVLDRFGRIAVLRGSFALAALGLLIVVFVPNLAVATVGAALWGLGSALGFPIGMSAAADDPRTAAARVGAVATIAYFAFLVGPPVIGFLGAQVGVLNALLVVLVLVSIGALVAGAARAESSAA
jgi:fucose permease